MAKAKLDPNCAIKVEGVGKTFLIPQHKIDSVRGLLFNFGRRGPYEKLEALQDVSFEVRKGEFFGIIGRNGSGKSTLLKLLAGIYPPDRGRITVNGKISPFLELGVGFNPELTARENVYLNGVILGLTRKQIDQRFEAIINFAELERFVDTKLKNFSSGMYVRLAFAVAIQVDADILLMDEVLAVGDANFQAKCIKIFNRYREENKTVVLVTHDLNTVANYCDKVILLEQGQIRDIGKAAEVLNSYNEINQSSRELPEEKMTASKHNNRVDIMNVEFLDEHFRERAFFSSKNKIIARIHYKVNGSSIERPVFGVSLFNQAGINLSGPNTKTSGFIIDEIKGEGYVDFIMENLNVFTGIYLFTVAIFDWYCKKAFDYKDKQYSLRIVSAEENQFGIFKMSHAWKM